MAKVTKRFQFGQHEVVLETGEIARQAGGAVMVSCEGTMVLCTAGLAGDLTRLEDDFVLAELEALGNFCHLEFLCLL